MTRVLVVDDDAENGRLVVRGLAMSGLHAVAAIDAESAFALADEEPPDVAIVDLEMPNISGIEVIRRLKELHGQALHVMALTGHDDESRRAAAFEAGADDFVVKPAPVTELQRRVNVAIRTQRAFVQVRHEKEAAERRLVYGTEASALLAHDLNNGLAVATNNLTYLIETLTADRDQADALAATLRSMRRMSGLVANFVDIARFEDAAVKPIIQPVAVRDLLESVLSVHAPSLTQGIAMEVDCDRDFVAQFDAGLIGRVLHNLFGNAARYCNPGGHIAMRARPWNLTGAELSVTNSGPEVPDHLRAALFSKYARGKGGKRGMGLYFCRLVAEAHNGHIAYASSPHGPSFVMTLPGVT